MRRIQHALSGAVYEWAEDDIGPVQVTDKRGRQGRFDRNGRWLAASSASPTPNCAAGSRAGAQAGRRRGPQPTIRNGGDLLMSAPTSGRPTGFRGNGPELPGPAGHRQQAGPGLAAPRRARLLRGRGHPGRALPRAGVPRAGEGQALEPGVAVRLPRGGARRGRRHRDLRHLRHLDPAGAGRARPGWHQGVLQRVPAPRPGAARRARPRRRTAVRVPRLLLVAERAAQARSERLGLPAGKARTNSASPRSGPEPGAASSSSTWTPTASRSRTSSASCRRSLSAGRWRTGTPGCTSPRCSR